MLTLIGLNHVSAPVEVREKLDFSKDDAKDALKKLYAPIEHLGGFIISTCNRVEVYAHLDSSETTSLKQFLCEKSGLDWNALEPYVYLKQDQEVVRHLYRVACSLDSMVIGEPQILGQVKDAYLNAFKAGTLDALLNKLLEKTFSTAKRIRFETKISEQAVSISFAAIQLSKRVFSTLRDKTVMILGAGEMAELCARHLQGEQPKTLYFANRSLDHALELARQYNGVGVDLEKGLKDLMSVDLLIVSTGATVPLVKKNQMIQVMKERGQTPMFIVDISVPRNVEPNVNDLDDVYVYNIDDLKNTVDENLETRKKEAQKAQHLIDEEVAQFSHHLKGLQVSEVLQKIQSKTESLKQAELERLKKKISDPHMLESVDRSMEALMQKLLHDPIAYLKLHSDLKNEKNKEKQLSVLEIFGLNDEK